MKWLHEAHTEEKGDKPEEEGPPIDLDIFWHAHILDPQLYENDVVQRFGKVIWHCPKADEESS